MKEDFYLYLPNETEQVIKNKLIQKKSYDKTWQYIAKSLSSDWREFPNLALLLEKFIPHTRIGKEKSENKSKVLFAISEFSQKEKDKLVKLLNIYKECIDQKLKFLKKIGYLTENIPFITESRLIVGLGSASILETSITLHRIYGFPYIPGSAVKGVIRHYAIWKLANGIDEEEPNKKIKEIDKVLSKGGKPNNWSNWDIKLQEMFYKLQIIFGSEKTKGAVIFFDVLPLGFPKLEVDIMNPHYSEYYQGDFPPTDYLTPNPIPFLTVAPNQRFIFPLAIDLKMIGNFKAKELLEDIGNFLKQALKNFGIGAKTSIGYGYFI